MKKPAPYPRPARSEPDHGVALILTVLIVAMLTVLVVGFNAATRTEQMAARNYSKQSASRAMASTAEQEATALLASVLTNLGDRRVVTQPGRALVEASTGEYETNLLSSAGNPSASGDTFNLNTGGVISSNANPDYFTAPWIYVTNTVAGSNVVAGRYAYWIDDDGSRLNLNYAGTNVRAGNAFYPSNARPLDVREALRGISNTFSNAFMTGFAAALTNTTTNPVLTTTSNRTPTWGYFFSPRQVRTFATNPISSNLWRAVQFRIAGGSGNLTNNRPPADLGRTNLNGSLLTAPPIVSAGGASFYRNFLANSASANNSFVTEIDSFIDNQLETPGVLRRFNNDGFEDKYTRSVLRQIVVNLNDYPLATGSASVAAGSTAVSGAAYTNAEGIPRNVVGHRPFIYLNEIAFRAAQATNSAGDTLELQLWLQVELANPYSTPWGEAGSIDFEIGDTSFVVGYDGTNGARATLAPINFTWTGRIELTGVGNNVPANSFVLTMPNSSPPNQPLRFVQEYQIRPTAAGIPTGASNVRVENVTIEPSWLTLRQYFNSPQTVRDWAQGDDFPAGHFEFVGTNEIPIVARYLGDNQSGSDSATAGKLDPSLANFNQPSVRGIAKNDPRVRRYSDVAPPAGGEPWLPVGGAGNPAITMGANNSTVNMSGGTGIAGIPNDDPPSTGNDVLAHPDFDIALNSRLANAAYLSPFEMGRVHTGLQWRTLHLHAQESSEGQNIPDWALLDVFTVTNAVVPAATRLNPNALPYPAMDIVMNGTNAITQGLGRLGAYAGLINGFASGNSPTNAQIRVGTTLTNAGLPATAAWTPAQATTASSNLFTMRFNGNWSGRRGALAQFPTNAYGSLAEILEVDGVGNVGTSKSEKEAKARVVYETMSPYSDTFTIHVVGQALEVTTYGATVRTNVVGETRLHTQVTRDPVTGVMRRSGTEPVLNYE